MLATINNKNNSRTIEKVASKFTGTLAAATLAFAACGIASAQTVTQSLDSTFMHSSDKAAEMAFNDPTLREPAFREYIDLGIGGTDLRACQLTAFDGLFCLDGKAIRNWPTPTYLDVGATAPESIEFIHCADSTLNLDTRKPDTCTGMTVDFEGNVWLAGKNKGKTHSLIKIVPLVEQNGAYECPQDELGTQLGILDRNDGYCAFEFATGRPLLVDITPVDGALAQGFALPGHPAPQQAIIGLEERKTAVAFLGSGQIVAFGSGKQFWGLAGNEQLLGITLLQIKDATGAEPLQNIVLVTTSMGRILAYDTSGPGPAQDVFNFAATRTRLINEGAINAKPICSTAEPIYAVRASRRTDVVYASDSAYCEIFALNPKLADGKFAGLDIAMDENGYLILSTTKIERLPDEAPFAVPLGVTVAAGNSINLKNCGEGKECSIVPGATLTGVQLAENSRFGATVFKIDGIPDCRYVPLRCLRLLGIAHDSGMDPLAALAVLADSKYRVVESITGDVSDIAALRLNVTPMMPAEVTELFPSGMPDLWLPRYMRGQESRMDRASAEFAEQNFVFGGFFTRSQDGVVFRDTFDGEWHVEQLAGRKLGCDFDPANFLDWDVTATVSERYLSAPDNGNPLHIATITNSGCGSTRLIGGGFSFKPYNLEVTPCTFNPVAADTWKTDGNCVARDKDMLGSDNVDDAVYAKLLHVLMDELLATVRTLACKDADGNTDGSSPLTTANCVSIESRVLNATDKYEKCWSATLQPKQSSGDQNCQSFDSQLAGLYDDLGMILYNDLGELVYDGSDVANRIGELRARTVRMRHILETRFLPSLPDEGFDDLQ